MPSTGTSRTAALLFQPSAEQGEEKGDLKYPSTRGVMLPTQGGRCPAPHKGDDAQPHMVLVVLEAAGCESQAGHQGTNAPGCSAVPITGGGLRGAPGAAGVGACVRGALQRELFQNKP